MDTLHGLPVAWALVRYQSRSSCSPCADYTTTCRDPATLVTRRAMAASPVHFGPSRKSRPERLTRNWLPLLLCDEFWHNGYEPLERLKADTFLAVSFIHITQTSTSNYFVMGTLAN
ncbi:hypothetical protein F4782DRAFT_503576 [Xylaria castorea]|nr:hypothetical protein F4782DRAFT_503576 [Xylaria castorea]